jgi:hypothetical protein
MLLYPFADWPRFEPVEHIIGKRPRAIGKVPVRNPILGRPGVIVRYQTTDVGKVVDVLQRLYLRELLTRMRPPATTLAT